MHVTASFLSRVECYRTLCSTTTKSKTLGFCQFSRAFYCLYLVEFLNLNHYLALSSTENFVYMKESVHEFELFGIMTCYEISERF